MKNILLSFGVAGLTTVLLSSFALMRADKEVQEPKKERHIRMTKIENGKKTELDTILTNDDVFIWNGDTLSPAKHIRKFNPSGFDKLHRVDVKVDRLNGKERMLIMTRKGVREGDPAIWNTDSCGVLEIVTENIDSLGKKVVVRKRIGDGGKNQMIYFHDGNLKHLPPVPPMPPSPPHLNMLRMQHSDHLIDLNDPDIITYKKKMLKGDREKIEIIRKKTTEKRSADFSYEFGTFPEDRIGTEMEQSVGAFKKDTLSEPDKVKK